MKSLSTLLLTAMAALSFAQGSDGEPLDSCLIAIYQFDGNVQEPVNKYHATETDLTYAADRFGNASSAGYFNGTTTGVELPSAFDIANKTVSVWFKAEAIDSSGNVILDSDHANLLNGKTEISLEKSGSQSILKFHRGGTSAGPDHAFQSAVWHMATISICSNGKTAFYIDGDSIGETSGFDNSEDGSITANVGMSRLFDRHFKGWMDDLRIHNCCFSSTEVARLYEQSDFPFSVEERAIAPSHALVQASGHCVYRIANGQQSGMFEMELFDLTGRSVMTRPLRSTENIDLSHLPGGIYVATLTSDEGAVTSQKLVLH